MAAQSLKDVMPDYKRVPIFRTTIPEAVRDRLEVHSLFSGFRFPVFPGPFHQLGIKCLHQPLPFEATPIIAAESDEEDGDGGEADGFLGAPLREKHAATTILVCLKLQSLLKPSSSLCEVVALAGKLLGSNVDVADKV